MTKKESAKDDALGEDEFQRLLDACEHSTRPLLDRFLVLVMGVLGLRVGEVAHLRSKWVDFDEEVIRIPRHDPCGCGDCRQMAKQTADRNNISKQEALRKYWKPKTLAGARSVYFGYWPRLAKVIKKTVSKHGGCPIGRRSINRRIGKLAEMANLKDVHPHALRATAFMRYAHDGLNAYQLAAVMGWSIPVTVLGHFRNSWSNNARKALDEIYSETRSLRL